MAESKREGHARLRKNAGQLKTKVSAARAAAFEILMLIGAGRGHSDELLHGRHLRGLSSADRNLATTLVLGTLRWQIALDARIRPLLQRPGASLAQPVAIALRLGAYQLIHLDRIPAHAALSESVELTREAGQPHAAGMVNAVLRRLLTAPKPGKRLHESTAAFAERLAHPTWLVERWAATYGRDAALAICEADQQEPACGALFAPEADGTEMPIMDDGSRLVAELAAVSAPDAERVWDCCAAPGGKTLILSKRLPQAELLATDLSPRRLKVLAERLQSEAHRTRIELSDAVSLHPVHGTFDLILCDVPCTGTGTLARNPEIRHRLEPAEISRQSKRQSEILNACVPRLKQGGKLVYSTCSLEPEENERVVEAVLGRALRSGSLSHVTARSLVDKLVAQNALSPGADLTASTQTEALRTLPGNSLKGDGFFAAVFAKSS